MCSIDYGKYTRLISEKFGFFLSKLSFQKVFVDQLTTFDNQNLVCTESIYTLEDLSIYLVKTLITFADDKKEYSQELQFCRWTRFLVSEYPVCKVCIQVRVHVPFPFPRLDNIKIVKNNDSFIISIAVGKMIALLKLVH